MLLQTIFLQFFKNFNFLPAFFFRSGGSSMKYFKKCVRIAFFWHLLNDLCERYFAVTTVTRYILNPLKCLLDKRNSFVTVDFFTGLLLQTVTILLQTVTLTVTLYCYRFNLLYFSYL